MFWLLNLSCQTNVTWYIYHGITPSLEKFCFLLKVSHFQWLNSGLQNSGAVFWNEAFYHFAQMFLMSCFVFEVSVWWLKKLNISISYGWYNYWKKYIYNNIALHVIQLSTYMFNGNTFLAQQQMMHYLLSESWYCIFIIFSCTWKHKLYWHQNYHTNIFGEKSARFSQLATKK